MAVSQVKRFQHLQEQRTQAFHELGKVWNCLWSSKTYDIPVRPTSQNLPLPCSKIWRGFWGIQEGGQVGERIKITFLISLLSGVTERFQKISLEIIEIKKSLEEQDPPQTQAASMIARVQVTVFKVAWNQWLMKKCKYQLIEFCSKSHKIIGWWNNGRSWKRKSWAQLSTFSWPNNRLMNIWILWWVILQHMF